MFCQSQYSNDDIEIGRLLKESLVDSNARQLVFEGKREKYIFSENVLPTRRKRNLLSTSIKFYHICKYWVKPFFCSGKTFRQSNNFRDKSDIFWIKALQIFTINSWNPADLDSVTYNGLAGFSGPSSKDIQQITRVENFETKIWELGRYQQIYIKIDLNWYCDS